MRMISCDDRDAPFVRVFMESATRAGYQVEMIKPGGSGCDRFLALKQHYRHFSPNPPGFELASFRRWFEIAAVVAPDERFILADSDLVVYVPWDEMPSEIAEFDGLVASIGATSDFLEDGINGGFSVWTGRRLSEFCDYMVAVYRAGADDLASLHAAKVAAGNVFASISDMTLLYRWVEAAGIPFFNSNRLIDGPDGVAHYIDHNFFMPEGLGVRFAMAFGRKRLRFDPDGRAMLATRKGKPVRPISLHLGGRYKIMSEAIFYRRRAELASKSLYIWGGRNGRNILRKLGVRA